MVLDYFDLREQPFGVTPDSRYLFLGETHREAISSLLYGIEAGCGFVALIASPGLGKTTLLFPAMNQLREKARTVFLFQTVSTPSDLLRALLSGLGIREFKGSLTEMQLRLKDVLLEEFRLGKRVVVVIDEAQNLDESVLELVRMLSNFETAQEKLIQIVLSGQPQLAEKIASPELVQLRQRVSIVAQLKPFSVKETALYMEHRLRVADYAFDVPLFTKDATALIAEYSEGIPRNINNLCFNALALACALRQKPVDAGIIREVVSDLSLDRFRKPPAVVPPQRRKPWAGFPDFLAAAGASPWLAGSLAKVAVTATVLLTLGGALLATHPWRKTVVAAPTATTAPGVPVLAGGQTVQAATQATPFAVRASSSPVPQQPAPAESGASTVLVKPGKTLLRICVDNFGKCDAAVLQEIHRLNPSLNNLDHIEPGQSIRLPATSRVEQAAKAVVPDGADRE